jgi:hypothetical protein
MQNEAGMPTQEQVLEYLEAGKSKMGFETNFAVKKFLELPTEKQREIWEQLRNGDRDQRTEAARTLIGLVLNDADGLTKFVNETLGADLFDAFLVLPDNVPDKAEYIFIYFMTHLEQADDGFSIRAID